MPVSKTISDGLMIVGAEDLNCNQAHTDSNGIHYGINEQYKVILIYKKHMKHLCYPLEYIQWTEDVSEQSDNSPWSQLLSHWSWTFLALISAAGYNEPLEIIFKGGRTTCV